MKTSLTILLCVFLLAFLSACAPVYDAGRTKDEGQRTNDAGRTTNVLVTVTPVPTWTATPPSTATATPTEPPTPTPTRTLSPAESRAAQLPKLTNLTWRADGDTVKFYDAKNVAVAVFDQKTSSLRWDSQNHFAELDKFINPNTDPKGRAQLAKWLSDLKTQGVQFITYPDTRENFPPYVVISTADDKGFILAQGPGGTKDYRFDSAKGLITVSKNGSFFYYDFAARKFAPVKEEFDKLIAKVRFDIADPQQKENAEAYLFEVLTTAPYGLKAQEVNQLGKDLIGVDFLGHEQTKWKEKYPKIDFATIIDTTIPQDPADLLAYLESIGVPQPGSEYYNLLVKYKVQALAANNGWKATVQMLEIKTKDQIPLLFKEIYVPHAGFEIYRKHYSQYWKDNPSTAYDVGVMEEELSYFVAAYYAHLLGNDAFAKFYLNEALKGGTPMAKVITLPKRV